MKSLQRRMVIDEALLEALKNARAHDPTGLLGLIPRDGVSLSQDCQKVSGAEECVKIFKRERPHFFK